MKALLCGDPLSRLLWDLRQQPQKWFVRLVFLLGPWFSFAAVEFLNQNRLTEHFQPWQVLFNLIWYYIIFISLRLLLGRPRWAAACAMVLCFAFGLVNHYVLQFRGRILFPADLRAWRTAANVLDGFELTMDRYVTEALIVTVAYLFLVAVCPPRKKRVPMPRRLCALLVLSMTAYTYAFFFSGMLPALNIFTQQWATQTNGFLFNFTVALRYSVVDRPEGYSADTVEALMEQYASTPASDTLTCPTNIIVVMNEAFSDLSIFPSLEVSQDPTPFLHSMTQNTIRGWLYPPVTGGGTASTEFEFLTGLSNAFLPPHCVAYQLYMKEDTPALSSVLNSLGYETTAFHPYRANGWNRPIVYDYLDFDSQLYNTDVENPRYVRRYISDLCSYQTLFSLTDKAHGQPTFLFNVTMQNHSGYAQGWNNLPGEITLSQHLDAADPKARQYLCLMKVSDDALRQLVEHYEQAAEPTLIVFFGDHQPSLSNDFYEALYGKELSQRTAEEVLQQYAVPFFLWANYDIPEQQDIHISSNFLGVLAVKTAGLPMTGWMNFLSELYQQLPVVSPAGFITADGTVTDDPQELTPEQRQWLLDYEMLAYCALKDIRDENRHFFHLD